MSNPKQATVRHTVVVGKKVPDVLSVFDNICTAGGQCSEVQGSPVASQALVVLKAAVTTADASLAAKLKAATVLMAAIKALHADYLAVLLAGRTYETAVNALANGDATIINKAGLESRAPKSPSLPLGKVSVVHSKPGKHSAEAIITWPPGPGATGYAIEVNFTPQNPSGPYTALIPGTGRRRTVKGPTPGAQFLVHVASLGSGGTQSEWSDPILATAAF